MDDDGAGAGGPERPSGRPNWGTRQKFDDVVGKKIILHLLTTSIHVANTPRRTGKRDRKGGPQLLVFHRAEFRLDVEKTGRSATTPVPARRTFYLMN